MNNYPEEARDLLVRLARYANTLTPHKLDDPIDPLVAAALDQALSQLCELVRESVGKDENIDSTDNHTYGPKSVRNRQRQDLRSKWTLKEEE